MEKMPDSAADRTNIQMQMSDDEAASWSRTVFRGSLFCTTREMPAVGKETNTENKGECPCSL